MGLVRGEGLAQVLGGAPALQEDEGRGRAGEVRVALQAVCGVPVPHAHVRLDEFAEGDLEDLQLVFKDQGEQPLVGAGVDLELDGKVREGASLRGHLASEWSGKTEESWLCSVPVARASKGSTTLPSATTTPLASPASEPKASGRPTPASRLTGGRRAL